MTAENGFFCVDTHCHLNYLAKEYAVADVVARARKNGVCKMITVGTNWHHSQTLVDYHQQFPDVFCALGIHPENAKDWYHCTQKINFHDFVHKPQVVALGETGLDYLYGREHRNEQIALFQLHISVCKEHDLPIIIHCRAATEDMLTILRKHYRPGQAKGVIHCFQESLEVAQAFMELGFFISLSGMVTFKTSKWRELHQVVASLPQNCLLVETDAPYLTPEPHRSNINEPAYVPMVLRRIADLQGCDVAALARQIYENTHLAFPKLGQANYNEYQSAGK